MATSKAAKVQGALAFLSVLMPQLGPVVAAVPQLVGLLRGAFMKIGGDEAELDAILAANQIDIDRLKDPDSFRRRRPS